MAKPITPSEAVAKKATVIPDGVIEAFNLLIAKHFDGRESVVTLKEAAAEIRRQMGYDRNKTVPQAYLDVEPLFRKAGWKVKYEQPGYCESGDACYTFSK